MISKFKDTYDSGSLSTILSMHDPVKPVYVKAAYNYYKIKRIFDTGEFIILETPEEEGVIGLDNE